LFHAWSGSNTLATEGEGVTLRAKGEPTFSHYASWAPWAEVVRGGRFVWVSGGSSMVRIADGDTKPLVFDLFGSMESPVVFEVAPSKPPARGASR
jgi:hypothetical protein